MSFSKIEGENGIFEIRKIKVLYEVVLLENGYMKKNLDTNKIEFIKMEEK